jgi:hypothetical protein
MLPRFKSYSILQWLGRGQAMPEYAVIGGAIIVAAYLVFQNVGSQVNAAMLSVLPAF